MRQRLFRFFFTVPLTKTRKVKVQQNLILVEFAETVKLLDLHFCELVPSFEVGTAWPETHTKRQATQHGCLLSLLCDGDKRSEIVYGEEKYILYWAD
jgi:hypothetical protein